MSSSEDSDDEFQSADEDIDFEPQSGLQLGLKSEDLVDIKDKNDVKQNSGQQLSHLDKQLNLISIEDKLESNVSLEKKESSQKLPQTTIESTLESTTHPEKEDNIKSDHKVDIKAVELTSDENKTKTVIKGRKLLRKADRLRGLTTDTPDSVNKSGDNLTDVHEDRQLVKESLECKIEPTIESLIESPIEPPIEPPIESLIESPKEPLKESPIDTPTDTPTEPLLKSPIKSRMKPSIESPKLKLQKERVDIKREDNGGKEHLFNEVVSDKCDQNMIIDGKTEIKGRKLMRKVDRLRDESTAGESLISEEKKIEVLNKLSDLGERDDTSSNWNNWFTDIKSAAMTATSTTVSHVSQASNKWSLNPKSLLTSAVSITSNVGSGISSVVENVTSVVDSAIGAPPPEQMAALLNEDSKVEKTSQSDEQKREINESQNKSSLGFGLFDYTFNTLESIGKKTMEVIVDDKHKRAVKTDKTD